MIGKRGKKKRKGEGGGGKGGRDRRGGKGEGEGGREKKSSCRWPPGARRRNAGPCPTDSSVKKRKGKREEDALVLGPHVSRPHPI